MGSSSSSTLGQKQSTSSTIGQKQSTSSTIGQKQSTSSTNGQKQSTSSAFKEKQTFVEVSVTQNATTNVHDISTEENLSKLDNDFASGNKHENINKPPDRDHENDSITDTVTDFQTAPNTTKRTESMQENTTVLNNTAGQSDNMQINGEGNNNSNDSSNSSLTMSDVKEEFLDSIEEKNDMKMNNNKFQKFKEETFEHLKLISDRFKELDVYSEKCAPEREDILKEMQYLSSFFHSPEEFVSVKFRLEVAQFFIDSSLLTIISNVVTGCPKETDYTGVGAKEKQMVQLGLGLLFNYTDESDSLANEVAKTKVVESCKHILDMNSKQHVKNELTSFTDKIIDYCTGLVQNISVRSCNVDRLRSLDFTKVLQPYLKSQNEDIRMTALTILANIVNEEESNIIGAHVLLVARLLIILERGLEKKDRRYSGWSCKELGHAVRNLARNDANKKLLWNLNALQILIEMARTGDDEEQFESVHAIWALAYDEEIRKSITSHRQTGVVELLLDLQKTTSSTNIQNTCTKTLWTLREELKDSPVEEYRRAVDMIPSMPTPDVQKGHIMISYQSADRKMLCKIKELLTKNNYKVWMDVDEMCGSTLQAMADAVENASIVLLCFSRRYKESDNCRLEAEYAHERRKPIVPLKMELNYKPDGWLGLMLGSKLYIEFSGKYSFEGKLKGLFKEISRLSKQDGETRPPPIVPSFAKVQMGITGSSELFWREPRRSLRSRLNSYTIAVDRPVTAKAVDEVDAAPRGKRNKVHATEDAMSSVSFIRKWSTDDVLGWLSKHDLRKHGLEKLTGEEVAFLALMRIEAPEQLYDCVRHDLKINTLLVKARLVWALCDLTKH